MTVDAIVSGLVARGLMGAAVEVAADHHVTVDELLGRDRYRHIVQARRAFVHVLRARGLSLPAIGALLDRDHTSVLHLIRPKPRGKAA